MNEYKAFMSYSSAADSQLAAAFQRSLHQFARPWYRLRSMRIFRDETSLSSTPKLWGAIEAALQASEYFILLASPDAARSTWVCDEVQWWLENRTLNKLRIVLTDGNVFWDGNALCFNSDKTDALPANLMEKIDYEPKYVDLRWARSKEDLSLRKAQFRTAVLDIAAPLLGEPKDLLDGEDIRQHHKTKKLVAAVLSTLFVLSVTTSLASYFVYKRGYQLFIGSIVNMANHTSDPLLAALLLGEIDDPNNVTKPYVLRQVAIQASSKLLPEQEFTGHSSSISSGTFSRDGSMVVTASADYTARIWSLDGQREAIVLKGHRRRVTGAEFSPDGSSVVTASYDGTARIWKVDGKEEPAILEHEGILRGMNFSVIETAGFSKDGHFVLTNSQNSVRIWNINDLNNPIIFKNAPETYFVSATFNANSTQVAAVLSDGSVRIYDVNQLAKPIVLKGHQERCEQASFSLDGNWLVTASADHTARIWRSDGTGKPIILRGHTSGLLSAAFNSDNSSVVTSSNDGTVRVWPLNDIESPIVFKVNQVTGAVFSPDDRKVLIASEDGTSTIWDVFATGKSIKLTGHKGEITTARYRHDGAMILTTSQDGTARIWPVEIKEPKLLQSSPEKLWRAALSNNEKMAVSAANDGTAWLFNLTESTNKVALKGHNGPVFSVNFSPDDKQIITTGSDNSARIWDVATATEQRQLTGHRAPVLCGAFSPNGKKIITCSLDRTARIWNTNGTGEPITLTGHKGAVTDAAFSPDNSLVATASFDGTIKIWDSQGQPTGIILQGHIGRITHVSFSPNSQKLVSASFDRTARIWDVNNSEPPIVLNGHKDTVWSATFSADGLEVLTASEDRTFRIWRIQENSLPIIIKGHSGQVRSASFNHEGSRILTASFDGTVRLWQVGWEQLIDYLGASTRVCLTSAQRSRYLNESPKEAQEKFFACRISKDSGIYKE